MHFISHPIEIKYKWKNMFPRYRSVWLKVYARDPSGIRISCPWQFQRLNKIGQWEDDKRLNQSGRITNCWPGVTCKWICIQHDMNCPYSYKGKAFKLVCKWWFYTDAWCLRGIDHSIRFFCVCSCSVYIRIVKAKFQETFSPSFFFFCVCVLLSVLIYI